LRQLMAKQQGGVMKCPQCLAAVDDAASECQACGSNLGVREPVKTDYVNQYFEFRWLIAPALIRLSYGIGALAITLFSVLVMIMPEFVPIPRTNQLSSLVVAALMFTVGNIAWRILCEGIILFFSIHEAVVSLDEKTRIHATQFST